MTFCELVRMREPDLPRFVWWPACLLLYPTIRYMRWEVKRYGRGKNHAMTISHNLHISV